MGKKGKRIGLSKEERKCLGQFIAKGEHPCRIVRRVQTVLALDYAGGRSPLSEAETAKQLGISRQTIQIIKRDFFSKGIEGITHRKRRETPPVPAKVDGKFEAHLIALCCGDPPEGYSRWSVRLLANKCVELGLIESVSHMTISRTLKKTNLNRT